MQLAVQARFYRILSAAWRHRYLLVIPPLVMPFIGFGIGAMTPRVYESHTSFLIQESAKLNPFLKDLSVETQIQQRMKALSTLLHSRHILQQVAEEQGLVSADDSAAKRDSVVARLSSRLTVNLYGKDLINIQYRSPSRENMAALLTNVREVFINQLLAPERSSVSSSEKFLLDQLNRQRTLLDEAEKALSAFKSKYAMQLPGLMNANVTEIGNLKRLIAEKETELAGQEGVQQSLNRQLLHTNPIVGVIEKEMIQVKSDLVNLTARYTEKHSLVVTARKRLERLENERRELIQLLQNVDSVEELERLWQASGVAVPSGASRQEGTLVMSQLQEIESSKARFTRLQQELATLKQQQQELLTLINSSGDTEQTLLRLSRDLEVQRKVYRELLDRYERAKITGALGAYEERDRIKIIDQAFEPSSPSNLSSTLFAVAGLVAGLALGAGVAILLEVSDSRLRYITDVQDIAGVPVLSRLPRIREESYVLNLDDLLLTPDDDEVSGALIEGEHL